MEVFPGISMMADVCDGKPCPTGTVSAVASIVGMLGNGRSFEEVEEVFGIHRDHVLTALRYASYVTDHLPLRLPAGSPSGHTDSRME